MLGYAEARRDVEVLLKRGSRGEHEETCTMGFQALMSVRELLPLDVERIAQGLYAESASLQAHVTHGISRLDVERLSQMVEVNEGSIAPR